MNEKNKMFAFTEDAEVTLATWDIVAPENIIEDSARGFISAAGNLMGPTIEVND